MNESEKVIKAELVDVVVAPVRKKSGPKPKAKVSPVEAAVVVAAPVEVPVEMPVILTYEEQRRKDLKEKIARERAYKAKLVTGKFLFNECPGGELKFSYREFPGDQKVDYVMRHDTVHTIPLGVAQHLNDRCSYPEYQHNLDNGKAISAENMYVMSKVHRTSFIPMDFSLAAGPSNIIQVSNSNPLDNRYNLDATGR